MNGDLESIFTMNEMLNRAGMDTISAGEPLPLPWNVTSRES
jgi:hypothetical protein